MLSVDKVGKSFGPLRALFEVSFEVAAGEAMCLLGANGAGKTTMMNLCLGFLRRDSGEIRVCEHDPDRAPVEVRRNIAYIPEHVALYEGMTGLENLAFFDRLSGHTRSESALLTYLESAGLEPNAARRPVSVYSKGMRQKVGLAIAQAKDAKVLLLDEPMSGLDPSAAREFTASINLLKQEGRAILIATHDIFRAKECATRIGIMKSGALMQVVESSTMDARGIEQVYLQHIAKEQAS